MTKHTVNWQQVAEREIKLRENSEKSLEEMRRFLFDYFYLLGPDPRENMSIVVNTLGKVLGSSVALYNRMELGLLKTWCIDNEPDGFKREDCPDGHICYDMTIRRRGVSNVSPVVLNNLEGSEWEKLDANVRKYGLKSYLGFPILVEEEVIGSLCVIDTEIRNYSEVEIYIIEAFASAIRLEEERLLTQNRLASANDDLKRKNKEIETLALTDPLTELPNRRAIISNLEDEISTLRRRLFSADEMPGYKEFSVALCDIDNFKSINDTYGHNCGDTVLKGVAEKLLRVLRAQDMVARWGGEEFLVLFRDIDTSGAALIAERLRKAVSKTHFSHDGQSFQVTITLGLATCRSADLDVDTCVQMADTALYAGKEGGRNRVVISALE